MGYLQNTHIHMHIIGKRIENIILDSGWVILVFDDKSGLKLRGSVRVDNKLLYTGGKLEIVPNILAVPLDQISTEEYVHNARDSV